MDFLKHEMLEATLLHRAGFELKLGDIAILRGMVEVGDIHGIRGDQGDIAIIEVNDPTGVRDQCRRVRGYEAFTFADADDERTALASDDNPTGLIGGDDRDAVGTFNLSKRTDDGLTKVALVIFADEPRDGLGVRLRGEDVALGLEFGSDDAIVLDDAIMHQPDTSAGVRMRMSVSFGRGPVSRPTGMGDSNGSVSLAVIGPFGTDLVGQPGDLTDGS